MKICQQKKTSPPLITLFGRLGSVEPLQPHVRTSTVPQAQRL